jgi:hypothetical protein
MANPAIKAVVFVSRTGRRLIIRISTIGSATRSSVAIHAGLRSRRSAAGTASTTIPSSRPR